MPEIIRRRGGRVPDLNEPDQPRFVPFVEGVDPFNEVQFRQQQEILQERFREQINAVRANVPNRIHNAENNIPQQAQRVVRMWDPNLQQIVVRDFNPHVEEQHLVLGNNGEPNPENQWVNEVGLEEAVPQPERAFNGLINADDIRDILNDISYNNKPKQAKFIEYTGEIKYRTILSKDNKVIHIQCPKDFNGTKEELVNNLRNYKPGFVQLMEIPNPRKKINSVINNFKGKFKIKDKLGTISNEEFYSKIDKYLTRQDKNYLAYNGYNDLMNNFTNTIGNRTCTANVQVCGKSNGDNFNVIGITTGKFDPDNNCVEVLGVTVNYKGLTSFNISPFATSKLGIYYIYYDALNKIPISKRTYEFCKVKILDNTKSVDIFGFKNLKKQMIGKTFNPSQFRVIKGYNSLKLKKEVDIIEILAPTGNYIKFLLSEVEFYYLDFKNFKQLPKNSKFIQQKSVCKIIDDRRTNLKKGDVVDVLKVELNKNSAKNSLVVIRDRNEERKVHKVLLKQLKIYNDVTETKSEPKKEYRKSNQELPF